MQEALVRRVVLAVVVALLVVGAFLLIRRGTRPESLVVGAALILVGLPLLAAGRRQLGSAFSMAPRAKGLVTSGLYSKIPHPMYVFLDMALLGGIVVLRQPWLLVVWCGLVAIQVWQARREAKVLEQAFGDAYRQYRARTWW